MTIHAECCRAPCTHRAPDARDKRRHLKNTKASHLTSDLPTVQRQAVSVTRIPDTGT